MKTAFIILISLITWHYTKEPIWIHSAMFICIIRIGWWFIEKQVNEW